MTDSREPLANVLLTTLAVNALEFAAARRRGAPISTTCLMLGILDADVVAGWDAVQLQTTYLGPQDILEHPDPSPEIGGTWHKIPLTKTATDALTTAVRVAADYHLVPLPPGVLALGLLASPASGASRALLDEAAISHDDLLELIQGEVLDVDLDDLDIAQASAPPTAPVSARVLRGMRRGRRDPGAAPPSVQSVDWGERELAAYRVLLSAIEAPDADADFRQMADAMLLSADELREMAAGTAELPDEPAADVLERARRRFEQAEPDAAAIVASVAIGGSPRITEVMRRLGLSCAEVAAQFAELSMRRDGAGKGATSTPVFLATVASGLLSLATFIVIVVAALDGALWKLIFAPLAWYGYPQSGPMFGVVFAALFALFVSPLAGAVQLASVAAEIFQAQTERGERLVRTGVALTFAEQRRVTVRFLNARGRLYHSRIQRLRATMRASVEDRT